MPPARDHNHTLELVVDELRRVGEDVREMSRDTAEIKVQIGKLEWLPDRVAEHEKRLTKQEIEAGKQGVRVKTLWAVAGAAAATVGSLLVWLFKGG